MQLIRLAEQMQRIHRKTHVSELDVSDMLRDRFIEGVYDENLRRELRRCFRDKHSMTFFELREWAVEWLGDSKPKIHKYVEETATDTKLDTMISLLTDLTKSLKTTDTRTRSNSDVKPKHGSKRTCYRCKSDKHLIKDCPEPAKSKDSKQNKQKFSGIKKLKQQNIEATTQEEDSSKRPMLRVGHWLRIK